MDAMPGKQMAIDAELNSGAIDEIEAKETFDKSVKGHEVDLAEYQARKDGLKSEMKQAATSRTSTGLFNALTMMLRYAE